MSNQGVRSQALRNGRVVQRDWSLEAGRIAAWLSVIAFGGVIWVINGGFSVQGLGVICNAFNEAGRLFWAATNLIRFPLPVSAPGLSASQPLIPWIGVLAASVLQVVVLYRRRAGLIIPIWMSAFCVALTGYDFFTTLFGTSTVEWIAKIGWIAQIPITLVLTFALELTVGFMLRVPEEMQ